MSEEAWVPTVPELSAIKGCDEQIVALAAYDVGFGGVLGELGVDLVLAGGHSGQGFNGHITLLSDNTLGITPGKRTKFSGRFLQGADEIPAAIRNCADDVRPGRLPASGRRYGRGFRRTIQGSPCLSWNP